MITAHYPPYHLGGYEVRSMDVVEALARKGHEMLVVTTRKMSASKPQFQAGRYRVIRGLYTRGSGRGLIHLLARWRWTHAVGMLLFFARELLLDVKDLSFVDSQIEHYQPDVIYLGHVTCLSRSLMPYLAERRTRIVHDEGGSGLVDCWQEKNIWYKFVVEYVSRLAVVNALKPLIVKMVCSLSANTLKPRFAWPSKVRAFFNDELNYRNAIARGVPLGKAEVIRSGVDTGKFRFTPRSAFGSPLRLIVPGRIERPKGQLDAVRLLAKLRERGIEGSLTLVGATWSDAYRRELVYAMRKLGLDGKARLMPMVPQSELAALYREADVCFFPSYYGTGFSRVPLEAMACGCIVISYGNEGSDEIIRDRQNGFLVPPGDLGRIAEIVEELTSSPEMVRDIAANARRQVEAEFSLDQYVDKIEKLIMDAVGTS